MHSVYEKRNDNPEFKGNLIYKQDRWLMIQSEDCSLGRMSARLSTRSIGGLTYKDENGKDKPLFTQLE